MPLPILGEGDLLLFLTLGPVKAAAVWEGRVVKSAQDSPPFEPGFDPATTIPELTPSPTPELAPPPRPMASELDSGAGVGDEPPGTTPDWYSRNKDWALPAGLATAGLAGGIGIAAYQNWRAKKKREEELAAGMAKGAAEVPGIAKSPPVLKSMAGGLKRPTPGSFSPSQLAVQKPGNPYADLPQATPTVPAATIKPLVRDYQTVHEPQNLGDSTGIRPGMFQRYQHETGESLQGTSGEEAADVLQGVNPEIQPNGLYKWGPGVDLSSLKPYRYDYKNLPAGAAKPETAFPKPYTGPIVPGVEKGAMFKRAEPGFFERQAPETYAAGKQFFQNATSKPEDLGAKFRSGAMGKGVGDFLDNNRWAQYGLYGLPIGAGIGLLGGLTNRKRKGGALGDALTGGLLGMGAGAGIGGAMDIWGGKDKPVPKTAPEVARVGTAGGTGNTNQIQVSNALAESNPLAQRIALAHRALGNEAQVGVIQGLAENVARAEAAVNNPPPGSDPVALQKTVMKARDAYAQHIIQNYAVQQGAMGSNTAGGIGRFLRKGMEMQLAQDARAFKDNYSNAVDKDLGNLGTDNVSADGSPSGRWGVPLRDAAEVGGGMAAAGWGTGLARKYLLGQGNANERAVSRFVRNLSNMDDKARGVAISNTQGLTDRAAALNAHITPGANIKADDAHKAMLKSLKGEDGKGVTDMNKTLNAMRNPSTSRGGNYIPADGGRPARPATFMERNWTGADRSLPKGMPAPKVTTNLTPLPKVTVPTPGKYMATKGLNYASNKLFGMSPWAPAAGALAVAAKNYAPQQFGAQPSPYTLSELPGRALGYQPGHLDYSKSWAKPPQSPAAPEFKDDGTYRIETMASVLARQKGITEEQALAEIKKARGIK